MKQSSAASPCQSPICNQMSSGCSVEQHGQRHLLGPKLGNNSVGLRHSIMNLINIRIRKIEYSAWVNMCE